jgi:hypothetical protein
MHPETCDLFGGNYLRNPYDERPHKYLATFDGHSHGDSLKESKRYRVLSTSNYLCLRVTPDHSGDHSIPSRVAEIRTVEIVRRPHFFLSS